MYTYNEQILQHFLRDREIQRKRYREGESKTDKERQVKRQRDSN